MIRAILFYALVLLGPSAFAQNNMRFHMRNQPSWSPLYLGTAVIFWVDASDSSTVTVTYATTSTTGTGTSGSNTITSAANVATLIPVGTILHLGADTTNYTVTAINTTTITVSPALVASYSAQTIYRGLVSALKDKSTFAHNVSNATASTEPIYMAHTINNLPGLFVSGTQFLSTSSNATWLTGASYSIAVLAQLSTTANAKSYPIGTTGTTTDSSLHWGWRASNDFTLAQYGDDGDWTTSVNATTTPTLMLTNKISNSSSTAYINGSVLAGTVTKPSANLTPIGPLNVGCGYSTSAANWYGYINEEVVVLTSLSTANQQKLEGYLAWKWGTQANLPGTHPYKNFPP